MKLVVEISHCELQARPVEHLMARQKAERATPGRRQQGGRQTDSDGSATRRVARNSIQEKGGALCNE